MVASSWQFYNSFRRYMSTTQSAGVGIDLSADEFLMALYTSAAAATIDDVEISVLGSLTGQVANGNGYLTGGKTLAGVTWSTGATTATMRFDVTSPIWTAGGGDVADIKYAVIYRNGASAGLDKVIVHSRLTADQFTVSNGNTLTITVAATGVFELT